MTKLERLIQRLQSDQKRRETMSKIWRKLRRGEKLTSDERAALRKKRG